MYICSKPRRCIFPTILLSCIIIICSLLQKSWSAVGLLWNLVCGPQFLLEEKGLSDGWPIEAAELKSSHMRSMTCYTSAAEIGMEVAQRLQEGGTWSDEPQADLGDLGHAKLVALSWGGERQQWRVNHSLMITNQSLIRNSIFVWVKSSWGMSYNWVQGLGNQGARREIIRWPWNSIHWKDAAKVQYIRPALICCFSVV